MATKERKELLLEEYEAKIAEVNKACAKGTNAEVENKLSELVNIEKEYRALRESEVFAGLMDTHQAIEKHHFDTISHKKTSVESSMTGVEKSTRTVQIDLKKFCEVKGFDLAWYYELQSLNKRLTIRVAESIGVSAAEMKRIDDSYAMDKLASAIELGKTPTSDTQVVKHMQKILDMLSPNEGRVNKYDMNYIMACYTKRDSRAALKVQCSKHAMLLSLMGDVFYRIATGGIYGTTFKQNNNSTAESKDDSNKNPASDPVKDSTPKSEETAEVSDPKPIAENKEQATA